MSDSMVHRLERDIREAFAFRTIADPVSTEEARRLRRSLATIRDHIRADDALRLEVLIDRLSGDATR